MGKKLIKTPRIFKRRVSRRHEQGWCVYEIDPDGPPRGIDVFESFNERVAHNVADVLNSGDSPFHYQVRMFRNT